MRIICSNPVPVCVLLGMFVMQSIQLNSQISPAPNRVQSTTHELHLVARKESREFIYKLGMPVRLVVKDDRGGVKKVKGYLTQIKEEGILVESFKKNDTIVVKLIQPGSIDKIRKISRKQRKAAAFALGAAAVYSGIVFLLVNQGPLTYILFIPPAGIALAFIYYYPATFLIDLMQEHGAKKGWSFSISRR